MKSLSFTWVALLMGFVVTHAAQNATERYTDSVDVERVVVDARAVDRKGQPLVGLDADDFRVTIGGKPVAIESVTWIGGATPVNQAAAAQDLGPGRLIIFLFQKDIESSRLTGLMRMLVESQRVLDELTAADRIAVLSFDYQLKVWLDFTNDREAVRRVFHREILFEEPPPVQPISPVSLTRRLESATASRTYTIEKALHRIADALRDLPGSKSIVMVGHGFGRLGWTGVAMEDGYEEARDALMASRTSVFSLDVTNADRHSLDAGLQLVSRDTGGFFARTHLFTQQAMNRLSGVLAGYLRVVSRAAECRPRHARHRCTSHPGPGHSPRTAQLRASAVGQVFPSF